MNYFLGIAILLIFNACQPPVDYPESVASKYCGACHALPDPDILPKDRWDFTLSYMGFYLGVKDYAALDGMSPLVLQNLRSKERVLQTYGMIPDTRVVSEEEWSAIREYLEQIAPDEPLPQTHSSQMSYELPGFNLDYPSYQPIGAIITWLEVNASGLQLANSATGRVIAFDNQLFPADTIEGVPLVVKGVKEDSMQYLLSIGDLMGGNVAIPRGYLAAVSMGGTEQPQILINQLLRPAHFMLEDVNNDGSSEIVISNFGDLSGSLDIYKNDEGTWKIYNTLAQRPGCVKVESHDFNGDGRVDIMALFSHENENYTIYYQQQDGGFIADVVIEKHSAFGHTYFELVDFNGDGHMDILGVNGDSDADPFNTPKNFHGARIYLNDGQNQFEEAYFYPMYGMHFAKAADFDNDGDIDIAATAFMADFHQDKPEQFVYLQNEGNLTFRRFTHPDVIKGRWMVMDKEDYDGDGDIDIALGAGNIPLGMAESYPEKLREYETKGKALLVFENTLIRDSSD